MVLRHPREFFVFENHLSVSFSRFILQHMKGHNAARANNRFHGNPFLLSGHVFCPRHEERTHAIVVSLELVFVVKWHDNYLLYFKLLTLVRSDSPEVDLQNNTTFMVNYKIKQLNYFIYSPAEHVSKVFEIASGKHTEKTLFFYNLLNIHRSSSEMLIIKKPELSTTSPSVKHWLTFYIMEMKICYELHKTKSLYLYKAPPCSIRKCEKVRLISQRK